ncbi:MAG: class II SORL domain-containing protein [Desulfobacterales bacterium]|nr:class II SORL domain-containing protein [Desulfobacterales bacterium]
MKIKRTVTMFAVVVLVIALCSGVSLANESAVTLEAPDQAAKGTEITVKIQVTHSANNPFHYTNWVRVMVNGQEAAFWEYSAFSRPDDAEFTKEINLTITEPMEIVAEANCNLHGSQGPAEKTVRVKN